MDMLEQYRILEQPYYSPSGNEVERYKQAYAHRIPLILKGPTGCGKTRFIEHMAYVLDKPLVTVSCNEDMSASDLIGRFLLDPQGTFWHDGPLTQAVRYGGICYLDEIVEARQDTTVVIHPLTDDRRMLPLDKKGELLHAHPDFQLVVSYNPGYQSHSKDMKASTRQRFAAMEFDYPALEVETGILVHEAGISMDMATVLVSIARQTRLLKNQGLAEGASTRMLLYAARLILDGMSPRESCEMTIVHALTDEADMTESLRALVDAHFA
jgi:nitric oxide reductase NorQ protein